MMYVVLTCVFEIISNANSAVWRTLKREQVSQSCLLVCTDDGEGEIDELRADLGRCEVGDRDVKEVFLALEELCTVSEPEGIVEDSTW